MGYKSVVGSASTMGSASCGKCIDRGKCSCACPQSCLCWGRVQQIPATLSSRLAFWPGSCLSVAPGARLAPVWHGPGCWAALWQGSQPSRSGGPPMEGGHACTNLAERVKLKLKVVKSQGTPPQHSLADETQQPRATSESGWVSPPPTPPCRFFRVFPSPILAYFLAAVTH